MMKYTAAGEHTNRMKSLYSTDASPHPKNIFGLFVTHPYWLQLDFWLACIVATLFWSAFILLDLPPASDITFPVLGSTLLLLIIVFPILEEIVFRGLIQESIHRLLSHNGLPTVLLWRISSANVLASLFFSASHLWAHSTLWALATLLPSLIFGYFKDKYQSLQPSIVLHIFYNLGFYLFL